MTETTPQEGSEKMEDSQKPLEEASAGESNESPKAEDGASTEAPADGQTESGADSLDELPSWAQNMVRSLRRESANYRTQLQEMRQASVKSESDFEDLKASLVAKERELLRERIGAEHNLPSALRDRLRGETAEELEADAKSVAEFLRPAPGRMEDTSPGGGLDSAARPEFSAEELYKQARALRY